MSTIINQETSSDSAIKYYLLLLSTISNELNKMCKNKHTKKYEHLINECYDAIDDLKEEIETDNLHIKLPQV